MWVNLHTITLHLFRQLAVISVSIILLNRFLPFRKFFSNKKEPHIRVIFLIIFFGIVSILGTYSGYPVKNAIANSRVVGIVVAGLLGGPVVGIGAGIISGVHRYLLGGLTINAAFISCVVQGWLAGAYSTTSFMYGKTWLNSIVLTCFLEILHFFIVILITRPVEPMFQLVKTIAPPMIVVNSIGVGLFIAVLETVRYGDSILEGNAAQLALKITNC